ncbi:MAG TPA: UDP-N-acetylmuramate dehydrogenase [Chloroflexota bacterium]|nr:UDP-N-acetylmuramate dehydrogenase [Chloroflexota bacterium]
MSEVTEELRAAGLRRVAEAEPMSRHTSWRIGGPADYFAVAETEQELLAAARIAREHRLPWLVLGGGNNVLVADAGIEGLVILNRLRHISVEPDVPQLVCGAGVFFARAAQFSARAGYTGMEWGIAIPGTVGGGVVNNAGAHWSDVGRSLLSADIVDADGKLGRVAPEDLAYRYRQSTLKTPHTAQTHLMVTSARFRIEPDEAAAALARVEDLRRHRLATQPVKEASAGSTFKNPPGDHAGALIDRVGLKGTRLGGACISPLHANFILNEGTATAADVYALIKLARERVAAVTGVTLEPEVQFVGRWTREDLAAVEAA